MQMVCIFKLTLTNEKHGSQQYSVIINNLILSIFNNNHPLALYTNIPEYSRAKSAAENIA